MMDNHLRIISRTPEQTLALAEAVGRRLRPGDVLALTGVLGSGKTLFVKGLAKGLDVPPDVLVTSPTYTLINEYPGRLPLGHADLYRLETEVDFDDIGLYDLLEGEGVAAVEWADRLRSDALEDHLAVQFAATGPQTREIRLIPYGLAMTDLLREISIWIKENPWD